MAARRTTATDVMARAATATTSMSRATADTTTHPWNGAERQKRTHRTVASDRYRVAVEPTIETDRDAVEGDARIEHRVGHELRALLAETGRKLRVG